MEDPRREAQRRLEEDERVRRLREGGEGMRAELATEEAQRAARTGQGGTRDNYLTPQEEQQRRLMRGTGEPYRGYGETQQAEMAMWSEERRRAEESRRMEERPSGAGMAGVGAYGMTRRGEEINPPSRGEMRGETVDDRVARDIQSGWRQGDIERRTTESSEKYYTGGEKTRPSTMGYQGYTMQSSYGQGGGSKESGSMEKLSKQEQKAHQPPPGEVRQEPTDQEKMKAMGGEAVSKTKEYGGEAVSKTKEYGGEAVSKTKEVGGQAWEKTKEMTSQLTEKTREATGGAKSEDVADRTGEAIGRGIKKAIAIGSGLVSGMRRGMGGGGQGGQGGSQGGGQGGSQGGGQGGSQGGGQKEEVRTERTYREPPEGGYRETEYREVKKREER